VCEQLVRIGVGDVTLVDDDVVTESNVSRIYGSTLTDIGRPKVEVVAQYANSIRGDVVTPIVSRVSDVETARRLRHCDVLFGCTDDQFGRSVLSRMSYWYLSLYIDLGVLITAHDGNTDEVFVRVTSVTPGSSCLLCRGRIQPEVIRSESIPGAERERLRAEGYVVELGEPDPSVITYTTLAASLATSELLNRLFALSRPDAGDEYLLRVDNGDLRTNRVKSREGHYCANAGDWGLGDAQPFLGQLWV
jgi:molybdopterin/thiamine biosynthesis adenylyltransferase